MPKKVRRSEKRNEKHVNLNKISQKNLNNGVVIGNVITENSL